MRQRSTGGWNAGRSACRWGVAVRGRLLVESGMGASMTMVAVTHLTMDELEAGLDHIRQSPTDQGRLELIVRRPQIDARELLEEGQLDLHEGLVGDTWRRRGSSRTADGSSHPDMQLNIM